MKLAVVYDWFDGQHGGAEQLLSTILSLFPTADLYGTIVQPYQTDFASRQLNSSAFGYFLGHLPVPKWLLTPLLPLAASQLRLTGYDVILTISSAYGYAVNKKQTQRHFHYNLTPFRYIYEPRIIGESIFLPLLIFWSHLISSRSIHRLDAVASSSQLTRRRWRVAFPDLQLKNQVLYPTIVSRPRSFKPSSRIQSLAGTPFGLIVGRNVPYKQYSRVIEWAKQSKIVLVVAGHRISDQSNAYIHNLPEVTQQEKWWLLSHATALWQPGIEDFGLSLLEAAQAGCLCITHPQSGACELMPSRLIVPLYEVSTPWLSAAWTEAVKRRKRGNVQGMTKYDTTYFAAGFAKWFESALAAPGQTI